MKTADVVKKLQLHTCQRALILNAPEGYVEKLGKSPEELLILQQPEGKFDFVQLFARDDAELESSIDTALEAFIFDGLLWISYPKGSSGVKTDINRDTIRSALSGRDIRPVSQVSIDETWSAMRFTPNDDVGQ